MYLPRSLISFALVTEHARNRLVPLAQLNAGYAYFQLEKHREAIDRFSKVGLTGNRGDTTSYWSARSHVALEEFEEAVRLLNTARKSFPESKLREQIEYLLGLSLFRDGRISDAKPQLLAFLQALGARVHAVLDLEVAAARDLTTKNIGEKLDWQAGGMLVDFPEGRIHGFLRSPNVGERHREKWQRRATKALKRAGLA